MRFNYAVPKNIIDISKTNEEHNVIAAKIVTTSCCEIDRKGHLIVVTEIKENTGGTSITNAAEYIATQYCKANNIPFDKLIYVEHYNEDSYIGGKREEEFSRVTFDIEENLGEKFFVSPSWKYLNKDEYQELLNSQSNVLWE